MKKETLLLLLLALVLLMGMLLTLRWGAGSRHGYGALPAAAPFSALQHPLFMGRR